MTTRNSLRLIDDFFTSPWVQKGLLGFDDMFDNLSQVSKYSAVPWNVVRTSDNTWVIECAVAGFSKDELKVEQAGQSLKISGKHDSSHQAGDYLYKGISFRNFVIPLTLTEGMKVGDIHLKDGMLRIVVEKAPTHMAKLLEIRTDDEKPALETSDDKAA